VPRAGGSPGGGRRRRSRRRLGGGGGAWRGGRAPQPQATGAGGDAAELRGHAGADREARDITLKLDVERFIRPISFRPGAIEYEPAPGAPANLAQRLVGG
jgi:DNA polymerase-3 subunit gamma/tau